MILCINGKRYFEDKAIGVKIAINEMIENYENDENNSDSS